MSTESEPHTLRLLTFPKASEPAPCDGSYTCICMDCEQERAAIVLRGIRRTNPADALRRAA
jgi:hypothetical protein